MEGASLTHHSVHHAANAEANHLKQSDKGKHSHDNRSCDSLAVGRGVVVPEQDLIVWQGEERERERENLFRKRNNFLTTKESVEMYKVCVCVCVCVCEWQNLLLRRSGKERKGKGQTAWELQDEVGWGGSKQSTRSCHQTVIRE